jgi:hypothetical protein
MNTNGSRTEAHEFFYANRSCAVDEKIKPVSQSGRLRSLSRRRRILIHLVICKNNNNSQICLFDEKKLKKIKKKLDKGKKKE